MDVSKIILTFFNYTELSVPAEAYSPLFSAISWQVRRGVAIKIMDLAY